VGAISPQSLENLLQSIQECLGSTDWATRKAAADALSALALNSSDLISDKAASTLTVLESCRFDKVASAVLYQHTFVALSCNLSSVGFCNCISDRQCVFQCLKR
jgi:hypothetical protein